MAPMIKTIKVAIYALALLQLDVVLGYDYGDFFGTQKLCNNKHLELRNNNDLWGTRTEGCPPGVEHAFKDFQDSVARMVYSCNMEKVTNLTRFADTYLRNDGGANLPQEFVNYAIAYGMMLASTCKKTLMDKFYKQVKWEVTTSDYEAIDEWIRDDGPIARLLDPISKQGEFPLPSDFIDLLPGEFEDSYKSALKLTDGHKYKRVREVCERRFRPIYAEVILPISHLVRNGFTYNAPKQVRDMLLSQAARNRYKRWSRIVFLCESLKDIQIIEGPPVCPPMIDVVPAAEADGQQEKSGRRVSSQGKYVLKTEFRGPQLGSKYEFRLDSAIKHYKSSLKGTERFKRRVLKNKGRLLMEAFESKETFSSLVKKACDIVSRRLDKKEAEELEATKKSLLSLLDSDKKSKFIRVFTKLARASAWALRKFAIVLEFILLFVWGIITFPKTCCGCGGGVGGPSGPGALAGSTGVMLIAGSL